MLSSLILQLLVRYFFCIFVLLKYLMIRQLKYKKNMIGDLIINGKDAWTTWGCNMSDGFLETILTPPPIKPVLENKSSRLHGKEVYHTDLALYDERDLNLVLTIEGDTEVEYLTRYESFLLELQKGLLIFEIPILSRGYKLTYCNSSKLLLNRNRTHGKFTLKFNEPNPADRV